MAAAAADEATLLGESRAAGISITIKDSDRNRRHSLDRGAKELADYVPTEDAPVVAAAKAAGAIVFGKTNLPLWSGDVQTFNELFGMTNNPWELDRIPGGSSGGAAAAVAAGFTTFELGTDIGGSVRIPAHFCGSTGSNRASVWSHNAATSTIRRRHDRCRHQRVRPDRACTEDLDLLLSVLAGPEPGARGRVAPRAPPAEGALTRDLGVGVSFDDSRADRIGVRRHAARRGRPAG